MSNKEPLTDEELRMKAACWVVCPWCDEPKCVGRFECGEIKKYVEKLRGESHDE